MSAPITERVLFVDERRSRKVWCTSPRDGLRHELVPEWCRRLWGDGATNDLVPARKFGWVDALQRFGQPGNHHAESYAMAVLERRVAPVSWALVDGRNCDPSGRPDWLAEAHETLYECFTLVGTTPKPEPTPGGVYAYGDAFLERAVDHQGGDADSVASSVRRCRNAQLAAGRPLTDPDVLALPARGGPLVAIEVKTFPGDDMHDDLAQENGLALLAALGVRAEVWWICDYNHSFRRPRAPRPGLAPIDCQAPRLMVRRDVDWAAARAAALSASSRKRNVRQPTGGTQTK